MHFHVALTTGIEVVFADGSNRVQHWRDPGKGAWRIDVYAFERYMDRRLAPLSFGDRIDDFYFGLEIADFARWTNAFTDATGYSSYRPRSRSLVSVGYLDWPLVKDLSPDEQLNQLKQALAGAVARVDQMKRKPRQFDIPGFSQAIAQALGTLKPDSLE
jgi:hypothetical protein